MKSLKTTHFVTTGLPPLFAWWCTLTTPTNSLHPHWREELASLIIPIDLLIILLATFAAIGNSLQLSIMLAVLCVMMLSVVLKRIGMFYVAGLLAVCSIEFGLAANILTWSGFSTSQLPLYALLVQTGFVVVAFFDPLIILIICALNCAFILVSLQVLPVSPEMAKQLAKSSVEILVPLINMQVFVSIVTLILASTLIRAISRADRAEEIATFERREREQKQRDLEMKLQLEEGIEQLLHALNAATSKGDFTVRVPLARENILWRVGGAVNNLLARLQGFRQEHVELEKTRAAVLQLVEYVRHGQVVPMERWTGTSLDPLILELSKQAWVSHRPSPPSTKRPFRTDHER